MRRLTLASCAALLVLWPVLVLAQSRTPPSGSSSSGSAAPRGGGDSGSAGVRGGSSGGGDSMGSGVSSGGDRSGGSVGSGSSGGDYNGPPARARSGGVRSGEGPVVRSRSGTGDLAGVGQPVPSYNRPRGDRPLTGTAVPRAESGTTPGKPSGGNDGAYYWNGWPYSSYGGWSPFGYYGYGYWGSYYSGLCGTYYGYPGYFGYTGGCGYPGFYRYYWMAAPWAFPPLFAEPGFDMWGGGGGYSPGYSDPEIGSVKFKVKPKGAEVWVDGYFEGSVDKRLKLRGGTHRVEIKALGYQTLAFDVRVMPGKTVTYTGDLKTAVR
jgi:hypothetical protein